MEVIFLKKLFPFYSFHLFPSFQTVQRLYNQTLLIKIIKKEEIIEPTPNTPPVTEKVYKTTNFPYPSVILPSPYYLKRKKRFQNQPPQQTPHPPNQGKKKE